MDEQTTITIRARGLCCLSLFLFSGSFLIPRSALAESSNDTAPPSAQSISEVIRRVIIEVAQEPYEDDRYWNKTSERFDGLRIRGLKISKRKKKVRHGFCRKYSATLQKPEKTLEFSITAEPNRGESATRFLIRTKLRARCEATFAHYVYGVKGLNGTTTTDADLDIVIRISIDPKATISFSQPIPELDLNIIVQDVDIDLVDVDLRKLGVVKGKFAELIGDGLEDTIGGLIDDQERRVQKKLQKEIDKIQGKKPKLSPAK